MAKSKSRSKSAKGKPKDDAAPSGPRRDTVQLIIGLAGVVVTGILLLSSRFGAQLPYCAVGSSCDLVQASAWSTFLGVPLPLLGLLSYLALAAAAQFAPPTRQRGLIVLLATSGFMISVYLTALSALVIKAYCIYCMISFALFTAAFVASLVSRPGVATKGARISAVIIGALLVIAMHANATGYLSSGGIVNPELRALAEHLDRRGAKFYGASWCPHCQQQKELFGGAARYLPYVECAPHGPKAPRATTCEVRDIRQYPTWIIDERRISRVMSVADLKAVSGFKSASSKPAEALPSATK